MTGVVSMDARADRVEQAAALLACQNWREGLCVRDSHQVWGIFTRHQAWGMFTATNRLRFCISRDGRDWDRKANYHPIRDVRHVVAYIQNEYERISRQRQV